ncbi:uncharacterized protein BJ171DRAFT_524386 [Polychytrium aggregatum]|uniref:uncharacterized protein n=1 Tax=Polychytrium aggregatum TaxID=110093 RepID=UPI0022FE4362|nr:uncharacterized protein BJ171DRAFT_524386 [Polychytrium aggregatum]KAI9193743.1 hypothetical protein BJ171DRAFT_524386 [Polychytrium aggregatum]
MASTRPSRRQAKQASDTDPGSKPVAQILPHSHGDSPERPPSPAKTAGAVPRMSGVPIPLNNSSVDGVSSIKQTTPGRKRGRRPAALKWTPEYALSQPDSPLVSIDLASVFRDESLRSMLSAEDLHELSRLLPPEALDAEGIASASFLRSSHLHRAIDDFQLELANGRKTAEFLKNRADNYERHRQAYDDWKVGHARGMREENPDATQTPVKSKPIRRDDNKGRSPDHQPKDVPTSAEPYRSQVSAESKHSPLSANPGYSQPPLDVDYSPMDNQESPAEREKSPVVSDAPLEIQESTLVDPALKSMQDSWATYASVSSDSPSDLTSVSSKSSPEYELSPESVDAMQPSEAMADASAANTHSCPVEFSAGSPSSSAQAASDKIIFGDRRSAAEESLTESENGQHTIYSQDDLDIVAADRVKRVDRRRKAQSMATSKSATRRNAAAEKSVQTSSTSTRASTGKGGKQNVLEEDVPDMTLFARLIVFKLIREDDDLYYCPPLSRVYLSRAGQGQTLKYYFRVKKINDDKTLSFSATIRVDRQVIPFPNPPGPDGVPSLEMIQRLIADINPHVENPRRQNHDLTQLFGIRRYRREIGTLHSILKKPRST